MDRIRKHFNDTFSVLSPLAHDYPWIAAKEHHLYLLKQTREQVSQLAKVMNLVDQCLKYPLHLSSDDAERKLLGSCLKIVQSLLPKEVTIKTQEEPLHLRNLLEEIQFFFRDKTDTFNISVNFSCPVDVCFQGDPLLTELILLNVLGKAIYRVPKNSHIMLTATVREELIEIKIQDPGFSLNKTKEALIKKAFELYIEENLLRSICQRNGLSYECSTFVQGFNLTKLKVPYK